MFQGVAFKFWTDREFPVLKELTEFSVSQQNNQQSPVSKDQDCPISGTNGVVTECKKI